MKTLEELIRLKTHELYCRKIITDEPIDCFHLLADAIRQHIKQVAESMMKEALVKCETMAWKKCYAKALKELREKI